MNRVSTNSSDTASLAFLNASGEMAERTRAFDWSSTSVGSIDRWPQSLRTSVSILLRSRFPMFIWWGEDLVQFYNDAYRPSLGNNGKHPNALGQPGKDCWPEIWPVIYPLIRQVLDGGMATWSEDQLIPIYRNGQLEDVYWTFSYSAIIDEAGAIGGVLVVCYENTEKMVHYKKLAESENLLSFAIEATDLATWDYNPLTNKFTSNGRLKRWFGLNPADQIDLPDAIAAMIESDRDRVMKAIQWALRYESGGFYDITYTIVNKITGESRIVRAKGRAWFNDEKIAYRFNGTLQDITEQEQARLTLEQAEQRAWLEQKQFAEELTRQVKERTLQLQRSNEDLMQFAHVITHDLKEPVRKIKIFSSRIKEETIGAMPEKTDLFLGKIKNAADRMSDMIEGVLNYSSLGATEGGFTDVDLNEVFHDIRTDLDVLLQQKTATLVCEKLPTVKGAPILIYQLFYNLVNNSLKFVRQGIPPVIIIKSTFIRENDAELAEITVSDNGIGFDQDQALNIFNSFTRLNSKDVYEGTGLGLALCKKIVERHGGTILATGVPNQGASITIRLPQTRPSQTLLRRGLDDAHPPA
jgi:signal transduction histidine kinase